MLLTLSIPPPSTPPPSFLDCRAGHAILGAAPKPDSPCLLQQPPSSLVPSVRRAFDGFIPSTVPNLHPSSFFPITPLLRTTNTKKVFFVPPFPQAAADAAGVTFAPCKPPFLVFSHGRLSLYSRTLLQRGARGPKASDGPGVLLALVGKFFFFL